MNDKVLISAEELERLKACAEIEKAQKWQRTSYSEQPDYDKYFSR